MDIWRLCYRHANTLDGIAGAATVNILDTHPRTRDTLSKTWEVVMNTGLIVFFLIVLAVMFRGYFGDWLP